ncbi:MAG: NAD(P)/FAD-dependent oxidoreductase [Bacteroidetes bacterium]|nr:NAD(P)/FAD-dependent oxidoreductase [Bacteroidota bacterium]
MQPNIPQSDKKRIVIIGGGFAGLKLAISLKKANFQVVLLDKNNYHQFQPLFYQVATAGLEPSAISFPFRKVFQGYPNLHFRETTVLKINSAQNSIDTTIGIITYDYLVIATGADTNFYNIESIAENGLPMKSVSEALKLRNIILENFEYALVANSAEEREIDLDVVIVGGGPTGVELAGALADLRNYVLPKDYSEIDFSKMQIHLVENGPKVLGSMSEKSSALAQKYLEKLNVKLHLGISVKEFKNKEALLSNGEIIRSKTLIWAAGIAANKIAGLPDNSYIPNGRILVNETNLVVNQNNIYAIGDNTLQVEEKYPKGHPQVAQVAIQQAALLSKNLQKLQENKSLKSFKYNNKGNMATVGRNLAVVDLPQFTFGGSMAWFAWMFVHLMAIVGVKNRFFIFINWTIAYFTKDQSLRLIIRPKKKQNFN